VESVGEEKQYRPIGPGLATTVADCGSLAVLRAFCPSEHKEPVAPAEESFREGSFSTSDRRTFRSSSRQSSRRSDGVANRAQASSTQPSPGANDGTASTPKFDSGAHGRSGALSGPASSPAKATLALFKTEAAMDAYLTNLAHELSMISEQPTSIFRSQAMDPVESLSQALEVLNGTVTSLSDVQSRAMRHVSFLSVCPALFHSLHICMVGWRSEIHFKTSDWSI
jgi:hypothetical protein